ncbi:MAG: hypothetical protein PVG90_10185 [Bacillota bacterium]|jgi:hypothetical protein
MLRLALTARLGIFSAYLEVCQGSCRSSYNTSYVAYLRKEYSRKQAPLGSLDSLPGAVPS